MSRHESFKSAAAAIEQAGRHGHVVNQPTKKFVTADVAAAYLGYKNPRSLYKAIVSQGIPHYRRGRRTLLFVLAELDAWVEGRGRRHGLSVVRGPRHA